jgi:hypothetical protein
MIRGGVHNVGVMWMGRTDNAKVKDVAVNMIVVCA